MDKVTHASVTLERTRLGHYRATTPRGGEIEMGPSEGLFSPVELLLAAIAGCSAVDVDHMTSRRAEPTEFVVTATGDKHTLGGNHMEDIVVTFRLRFPEGADGDAARDRIDAAIKASHEVECTVSRTVELPTPVTMVRE